MQDGLGDELVAEFGPLAAAMARVLQHWLRGREQLGATARVLIAERQGEGASLEAIAEEAERVGAAAVAVLELLERLHGRGETDDG